MATFTVTTLNDVVDANDNQTSLREALAQADANAGADVISFGSLAGTVTLNNALGALQINSDVSISGDTTGDGKADITIDGNRGGPGIAAADMHRVITVNSGSTSTLDALTITGGREYTMGGGIYVASGANLSLKNSTVTGNYVSGQEVTTVGGVPSASNAMGAGIANDGILVIQNSTISANGAGAGELKSAYGGGVYNTNFLSMTNVTVANNFIEGGAAEIGPSNIVVTPAGVAQGGGIANVGSGSMTLTNVTVTSNEAWEQTGGPSNGMTGGVFSGGSSAITITDSIILGNSGSIGSGVGQNSEATGLLTANGLNIVGLGADTDGSDHIIQATRIDRVFDVIAINPNTEIAGGVLADNGGKVKTVALDPYRHNPAIDAASSTAGATDARGTTAHDDANITNRDTSARDLGAFEQGNDSVDNAPPTLTGTLTATVSEGGSVHISRSNLYYADTDNLGTDITFTVSNLNHVRFKMDGQDVTTFRASDMTFGSFDIVHDGTENTQGSFSISVEDLDEDHSTPVASTFNLVVNPVNDAPVRNKLIADFKSPIHTDVTFAVANNFKDAEGKLTFSAKLSNGKALPSWIKLTAAGQFNLAPGDADGGTFAVTVTAKDTGGKTVTDTFNIIMPKLPGISDGASNGNDIEKLGGSNDTFNAGNGNNTVTSGGGNDTVYTGNGKDKVDLGTGNDKADLGDGNDSGKGGDGDDIINAGDGSDTLYGGNGKDALDGGAGNDKLFGDAGNDTLVGGFGNDELHGGTGDDKLWSEKSGYSDTRVTNKLFGDAGNDILYGGDNVDELHGGSGNDVIYGDYVWDAAPEGIFGGDDKLFGEAGDDVLSGGKKSDTLYGGTGNDTLTGGAGADKFQFKFDIGIDTITDFTVGTDKIWLPVSLAGSTLAAFGAAQSATDKLIYDAATGDLYYDNDADGTGVAVKFAVLTGQPAIAISDFIFV